MDETQEIIRPVRYLPATYAAHRRREMLCTRHHHYIAKLSDYARDNPEHYNAVAAYTLTLVGNCKSGRRCSHVPDADVDGIAIWEYADVAY